MQSVGRVVAAAAVLCPANLCDSLLLQKLAVLIKPETDDYDM